MSLTAALPLPALKPSSPPRVASKFQSSSSLLNCKSRSPPPQSWSKKRTTA
ncbi:hypothetical protein Mapa_005851 [Marchantia paleacea]|nr:hypothetical protein Mapa_005851 [Marchantia paleacea]